MKNMFGIHVLIGLKVYFVCLCILTSCNNNNLNIVLSGCQSGTVFSFGVPTICAILVCLIVEFRMITVFIGKQLEMNE